MSSLLNAKITAANQPGAQSGVDMDSAADLFAPLQKMICESLKALTGEECEAVSLDISASPLTERSALLEQPSIKIIFTSPANESEGEVHNIGLGRLSPSLAAYISRSSLHINAKDNEALADYIPTKLDALLLRPLTQTLSLGLEDLLGAKRPLIAKSGLTLKDLDFGKAAMLNLGEVTQVTLYFTAPSLSGEAETPAKTTAKPKAQKAADTSAPLFIELFLPEEALKKMSAADVKGHDQERPVLDPAHPWTAHMRNSLKVADVPIRAVVESCHMTIAECTRLEIGQVIALPGVSLGAVGLYINEDMDSDSPQTPIEIARGALGIFKKNRALKLTEDLDSGFTQDWDWVTI